MKSYFLATEQTLRQLKTLFFLVTGTLLIGLVGFMALGKQNMTGAFMLTLEAVAGKSAATTQPHGLVLGLNLFGAIIIWFAIWAAFALAVEGKFGAFFKEVRMISDIKNMKNHYIICGAGKVGRNIGQRLTEKGNRVVFIEKDKDIINKLRGQNLNVIDVGPIEEHVLKDAGIEKAAGVAIALGDDGRNLLLTITARELNPNAKIAVRASDPKMVPKLKKAGADFILLPEALGGVKLADALTGNVDKSLVFTREFRDLT
jgi:voltage-gated potassium channel